MRVLALAALVLAAAPIVTAAPAEARPRWDHHGGYHGGHRRPVCRVVWRHHHRIRRCY